MDHELENARRLGEAMLRLRPVRARYQGHERVFCPHALGRKDERPGVLHAFGWQYDGGSEHGDLPNWRCFAVDELTGLRLANGRWRRGEIVAHGVPSCLDHVEASVGPEHTAARLEPLRTD